MDSIHFAWHGEEPIFCGLNLVINENEFVGIIGNNGCGKSTLLSCIAGLVTPSDGKIFFEEKEVTSERDYKAIRKKVGLCLQNAADQLIFPEVLEDVSFGPLNLGLANPERIALNNLEKLDIAHLAKRPVRELSGGQTRLVALAGILAMQPKLLMLDEPFNGLDEKAVSNLATLLKSLPCAKLLIHHNQNMIRQLCTRVLRLTDGLLEEI